MLEALSVESPIEKEFLFKKILKSYGVSKLGARLNRIFEYLLKDLQGTYPIKVYEKTVSLHTINSYCEVRISTEKQRPFVFIPKEELGGAVVSILKNSFSISKDTLIKDVAREIFHNKKTGSKIVKKMNTVINYLISKDVIKQKDGVIRLTASTPVVQKTDSLKELISVLRVILQITKKKDLETINKDISAMIAKKNWTSR